MPRRLTLVVPSLAMGGAERVMSMMANHWSQAGDDVTLITLDSAHTDTFSVRSDVNRVALGLMRESRGVVSAVWNNTRRILRLRCAIRESRPDHVISFLDRMNVLTLLACFGLSIDVLIAEHTNPLKHDIGLAWSWLRRRTYPRCRALIVLTERIREEIHDEFHAPAVYVIPNAVVVPDGKHPKQPGDSEANRQIVAMGRLNPQKGFDLLIEAFSRIAAEHPDWGVRILGDGPQRQELESLVREQGLNGRVTLEGWIADPSRILCGSDLFVLSSRIEGFPNALLEAMACGLPVISFDCNCGPAEIIRDGIDGVLIPAEDVEALAEAMDRLMSDGDQRRQLAERAGKVTERFSVERYFEQWDALLSGAGET